MKTYLKPLPVLAVLLAIPGCPPTDPNPTTAEAGAAGESGHGGDGATSGGSSAGHAATGGSSAGHGTTGGSGGTGAAAAGAPEAGAAGAPGGAGGAMEVPCDFGEPNDGVSSATRIELGRSYQGLCVSGADHADDADYFELVTPSFPAAGGVIEVLVDGVQDAGTPDLIVLDQNGDTIVEGATLEANGSVNAWYAAAPSSKFIIAVVREGGVGDRFRYALRARYVPITDEFEPNNSKEEAKTIKLGEPYEASPAAPSAFADILPGEDQDWYKLTLSGNATIKVSDTPPDFMCDVELFDASGEPVGENSNIEGDGGGDCTLLAQDLEDGTYFIDVHGYGGVLRAKANAPVAPYVLGSYKLQVE